MKRHLWLPSFLIIGLAIGSVKFLSPDMTHKRFSNWLMMNWTPFVRVVVLDTNIQNYYS